jgi:flagellar biosynthetic protein FliQ
MTEAAVLQLGRDALLVSLLLSMPLLLSGLLAGLIVSVFQAVTQVQEMTLSYVPKMLAVAVAAGVFGAWMLNKIVAFAAQTFAQIPGITG